MKKFFSGLFTFLIILAIGALIYLHPVFFNKQLDKVRGIYYVHKGDKALKELKLQKAIGYYNRAVELYPEHYTAWYNLGNIYVVYEDYYSAVDAYEKAFVYSNRKSYKVNKGLAYYNRGVAYKQKSVYLEDDWEYRRQYLMKALNSYKEACKILKKDYDARYNLALTYHLLGDYRDAGLSYCKAIELNPMNYEAHYNLAILLRHLKYYKESLDELEKATTLITNGGGSNVVSRQRYVFDVMNDVTRTILANSQSDLVEKIGDKPTETSNVTYVNGKIVLTDELDSAILKNLKVCGAKKIFQEDVDDAMTEYDDVRYNVHVPGVE